MASAIEGKQIVTLAWTVRLARRRDDYHSALVLHLHLQPRPFILNIVDDHDHVPASRESPTRPTPRSPSIGYSIAALQVDGDDFLPYAAAGWATPRSQAAHGPTMIESVTYIFPPSSTSSAPSHYRAQGHGQGLASAIQFEQVDPSPVRHWAATQADIDPVHAEAEATVTEAVDKAEKLGTLNSGPKPSPAEMFKHVYAEMPPHLIEQRQELGY